jgi:Flp pilus assembly protein TadB
VIVDVPGWLFVLLWAVLAIALAIVGAYTYALIIAGFFAWALLVKGIQFLLRRRRARRFANPS